MLPRLISRANSLAACCRYDLPLADIRGRRDVEAPGLLRSNRPATGRGREVRLRAEQATRQQ